MSKQAVGQPRLDYDSAVEEALCFGWIDSKPRTLPRLSPPTSDGSSRVTRRSHACPGLFVH